MSSQWQISGLTTDNVTSLTTGQLPGIMNLAIFTPTHLSALTTTELSTLSFSQIGSLTSLHVGALSIDQYNALSSQQLSILSSLQISASSTLNTNISVLEGEYNATPMGSSSASTAQLLALTSYYIGLKPSASGIIDLTNSALNYNIILGNNNAYGKQDASVAGSYTVINGSSGINDGPMTVKLGSGDTMIYANLNNLVTDQTSNVTIVYGFGLNDVLFVYKSGNILSASSWTAGYNYNGVASTIIVNGAVPNAATDAFTNPNSAVILVGVSPSALDTLDASMLTGLPASQFRVYQTADQIASMTTTQITEITTIQIAQLSGTQISGLTTAQVSVLSTTQISGLKATQLGLLTPTQILGLTSTQIASLTSTQEGGLTSTQIGTLTMAQQSGFTSTQISLLSLTQLRGLTSTQISLLTTTQEAGLTSTQIAALTTTQEAGLAVVQISSLTTVQGSGLTTMQIISLTSTQATGLTATQVSSLTATQFSALGTTQISGLTTSAIAGLTTTQLNSLTTTQDAGLSSTQIYALAPSQISALTTTSISSLNSSQISNVSVDQFNALNSAQINSIQAGIVVNVQGSGSADSINLAGITTPININLATNSATGALSTDGINYIISGLADQITLGTGGLVDVVTQALGGSNGVELIHNFLSGDHLRITGESSGSPLTVNNYTVEGQNAAVISLGQGGIVLFGSTIGNLTTTTWDNANNWWDVTTTNTTPL